MWTLIVAGGCRHEAPPEPVVVPGWAPLLDAATRGDPTGADQWTPGLVHIPRDDDGGAAEAIGAASGFLHVAEDAGELAAAVAAIAEGCGRCHAAAAVDAPPPPGTDHADLAAWVTDPLVWSRPPAALPTDPHVQRAILAHPDPNERAAAALTACAACHPR